MGGGINDGITHCISMGWNLEVIGKSASDSVLHDKSQEGFCFVVVQSFN